MLVILLMQTAGITVVVPQGRFVYGSSSYVSDMLPALESRSRPGATFRCESLHRGGTCGGTRIIKCD